MLIYLVNMMKIKKKNIYFLDKDGDGGKKDFNKINVKTFIFELCECIKCNINTEKDEKNKETSDLLVDYLYKESQRSIRKARLKLASAEQSFEEMKKIAKRKKN